MASKLAFAAKTDVGLKRTNNEDNFAVIQSAGLYVLADGMGGHASGQVASTMCVSHVAQYICEMARQPGFKLSFPTKPEWSFEAKLLANAIMYANERVFIQSCKDRSMEGMGTTVTAIFNAPHGLVLAHVGDSRIYRVRKGEITQMTRDHSLMNHLIDKGESKRRLPEYLEALPGDWTQRRSRSRYQRSAAREGRHLYDVLGWSERFGVGFDDLQDDSRGAYAR